MAASHRGSIVGLVLLLSAFACAGEDMNKISAKDAAGYLLRRFDVVGHAGPGTEPDGEWNYQELAQYVNASNRPEGEFLNVTASNLMYIIDTDRNSSITRTELEVFLESRRDKAGLNGYDGLKRAREREENAAAQLEKLRNNVETDSDGRVIIRSKDSTAPADLNVKGKRARGSGQSHKKKTKKRRKEEL